jgi:hypothetical protein
VSDSLPDHALDSRKFGLSRIRVHQIEVPVLGDILEAIIAFNEIVL